MTIKTEKRDLKEHKREINLVNESKQFYSEWNIIERDVRREKSQRLLHEEVKQILGKTEQQIDSVLQKTSSVLQYSLNFVVTPFGFGPLMTRMIPGITLIPRFFFPTSENCSRIYGNIYGRSLRPLRKATGVIQLATSVQNAHLYVRSTIWARLPDKTSAEHPVQQQRTGQSAGACMRDSREVELQHLKKTGFSCRPKTSLWCGFITTLLLKQIADLL